ncbi:MAG: hypothetical protein ACRYGP_32475 [Janthinobacterium lividum]
MASLRIAATKGDPASMVPAIVLEPVDPLQERSRRTHGSLAIVGATAPLTGLRSVSGLPNSFGVLNLADASVSPEALIFADVSRGLPPRRSALSLCESHDDFD